MYHYHSVYDSEKWQEHYVDPGFHRHVRFRRAVGLCDTNVLLQVAVAKHLGLQALRLADSIILPLNTTHYALSLQSYLEEYVTAIVYLIHC